MVDSMERILGGKKTLHRAIQNRMDLIELSDEGITKQALLHLAAYMNFTVHQLAELLPVTERTIQRYTAKQHFSPVVSEHILQIAEVAARGEEVFGSREKFLEWASIPSKALSGATPLSLLKSRIGSDLVIEELGRIEHGVFA